MNPKILIVEDEAVQAMALEKSITGYEYETRSATNGKEALAQAEEWQPHLILLDLNLPDLSGTEVLQRLKLLETVKDIPVISISADNTPQSISASLNAGAVDYLVKPINMQDLSLKIRNLVELSLSRQKITELNRALQREKALLARYFSAELIEEILAENTSLDMSGRNLTASILFFDIRNSTRISEQLNPNQFAEFLSQIFTDVMDLIYGEKGSVNKMLGDGLLATFGCPLSSGDDAYHCVHSAMQIQNYMDTFNDFRPEYLKQPVHAVIGIATGKVFAGNIGSVRRMEYTVVGDPVNVAARLQSMTKFFEVSVLVDGETVETLGDRIEVRKVDLTHVRGKVTEIGIFELVGVK